MDSIREILIVSSSDVIKSSLIDVSPSRDMGQSQTFLVANEAERQPRLHVNHCIFS